jgi:hypothetical protein
MQYRPGLIDGLDGDAVQDGQHLRAQLRPRGLRRRADRQRLRILAIGGRRAWDGPGRSGIKLRVGRLPRATPLVVTAGAAEVASDMMPAF